MEGYRGKPRRGNVRREVKYKAEVEKTIERREKLALRNKVE